MKPLEEFITRWEALPIPVPFVDTINTQVDTDTLPTVWGSARLQSETMHDVTFGTSPYVEETGSVIVGLFSRSGDGRNALDNAVATIRAAFHGWATVDDSVIYTAVEGPLEVDETDGEWWRIALSVPYIAQTRRAIF